MSVCKQDPPLNFQKLILTVAMALLIAVVIANTMSGCTSFVKFLEKEQKQIHEVEKIFEQNNQFED